MHEIQAQNGVSAAFYTRLERPLGSFLGSAPETGLKPALQRHRRFRQMRKDRSSSYSEQTGRTSAVIQHGPAPAFFAVISERHC